MSQEGFGVVEEVACEADVFDFVVGDASEGRVVEAEYVRAWERHEYGRVCGDDELRVLLRHLFEHREERELSLGRERRFGLVEKI